MKRRAVFSLLCAVILLSFPQESSAQWVQTGGPGGGPVSALAGVGTKLFAGTDGGLFISTDQGASWKATNAGLPANAGVRCLGVSGPNLLANIAEHGIFFSSDDGANWTAGRIEPHFFAGTYSADAGIQCFAEIEPNLFAGTYSEGIFISADNGASWKAVHSGWPDKTHVQALAVIGTSLFAGTSSGVYLTADNGANWQAVNTGLPKRAAITCLAACGTHLFAGTRYGVYYSTELGAGWTAVNSGLPKFRASSKSPMDHWITFLAATRSLLFAGNLNNGVFISRDKGISWTAANSGLPAGAGIEALAVLGPNIFAGSAGGVYISVDNGAGWKAANSGLANSHVSRLSVIGPYLFARSHSQGFLSTDDGASWEPVGSRFPGIKWIEGHAEAGPYVFARTDRGIIRFRDNGTGWEMLYPGLPVKGEVWHLAACSTTLFASTPGRVFQSDNYGAGWVEVKIGLPERIDDLAVAGEDLYALAGSEGMGTLYMSTKDGVGWKAFKVFPGLIKADCLAASGQRLLAGGMGGIYTITNNGGRAKIVPHELPDNLPLEQMASCFAVRGTTIFACTNKGVIFSTDNGDNWAAIKSGLTGTRIESLALSGTYLFAGTMNSGVWRLPLADLFPEKR
jgi:photosystem II stability/assembly factor-like uncharacterized protein